MSFKDDYRKDNEKIVPDEMFLNELAFKMENEKIKQKRNKIRAIYSASAAVIMLAMVGGAFKLFNQNTLEHTDSYTDNSSTAISFKVATTSSSMVSNPFTSQGSWFEDDLTDKENLDKLTLRMSNSGDLKKLYCSDENTFDNENVLAQGEVTQLVSSLKNVSIADDEPMTTNSILYYMAVFESGDIIKFSITDELYINVNDLSQTFKIN